MRQIILSIILLTALAGCYTNTRGPSFDMRLVVHQDTMVKILTDFHLAEGMIAMEQKKGEPVARVSGEYLHTVLQRHYLSLASFEESVRYYTYHTETLNMIYEKVIENLSKLESQVVVAEEEIPPED